MASKALAVVKQDEIQRLKITKLGQPYVLDHIVAVS